MSVPSSLRRTSNGSHPSAVNNEVNDESRRTMSAISANRTICCALITAAWPWSAPFSKALQSSPSQRGNKPPNACKQCATPPAMPNVISRSSSHCAMASRREAMSSPERVRSRSARCSAAIAFISANQTGPWREAFLISPIITTPALASANHPSGWTSGGLARISPPICSTSKEGSPRSCPTRE